MNSHFSNDTLRENLKHLVDRPTTSGHIEDLGQESGAETRFDVDHTVQRMAYLAHLTQESTN